MPPEESPESVPEPSIPYESEYPWCCFINVFGGGREVVRLGYLSFYAVGGAVQRGVRCDAKRCHSLE